MVDSQGKLKAILTKKGPLKFSISKENSKTNTYFNAALARKNSCSGMGFLICGNFTEFSDYTV